MLLIYLAAAVGTYLSSNPNMGIAEGRCRPNEPGPALIVSAEGLKDLQGSLKLEVYPSNDQDFLADDNVLLNAGKTFRRVVQPVKGRKNNILCIRVPVAGAYSILLLHDRNNNRKFNLSSDGVGLPGNPKLKLSKPRASVARVQASTGLTHVNILLNYRSGLFSMGPVAHESR